MELRSLGEAQVRGKSEALDLHARVSNANYRARMTSTIWAVLAAIGTNTAVLGLAAAVLTATVVEPLQLGGWFQHLSDERIVEWSALAASAAGVAVAARLGGVRATVLFLAYVAVVVASAIRAGLDLARLCQDRLGCMADVPFSLEDAVVRQAPTLVGVAAGLALIPLVRRSPRTDAYPLEAAGLYTVVLVLTGILGGVRDPRVTPLAVIQFPTVITAVIALLALVAVGVVIALRSPSPTWTTIQFAALGAVFSLPLATSVAIHGSAASAALILTGAALATVAITLPASLFGRRVGVAPGPAG